MKKSGKILSDVMWEVIDFIEPGVTEIEVENLAEKLINGKGGEIAFRRVDDYKFATCISTNNVVVHGIPTKYKLKEGDIIGVDCGVYFKGWNSDMSETIKVKSKGSKAKSLEEDDVDKFLAVGKKALNEGIKAAVGGNRIGHISQAIQKVVEIDNSYSVVRALIGHGIGKELHEAPEVPGYLGKKIEKTPHLLPGMTIAIEVIYNMGGFDVQLEKDGWTISSKDNSLSGLFERTVAITDKNPIILTP